MQSLSRLWENVSVRMGRSQGGSTQLQHDAEDIAVDSRSQGSQTVGEDEEEGTEVWAEGPRHRLEGESTDSERASSGMADGEPLLQGEDTAAPSDTSGDIDFADEEDDDELEAEARAGGFFNRGFQDEDFEEEEDVAMGESEGEWDEEEFNDEGEDGEDEDDEDEESTEVCFGVNGTLADRAGTSLTNASSERPEPKIVGYLQVEMTFDSKGPSLSVRILAVELKMALTKFRRKSNKKMRWTHMQVCMTLLPDKTLKFRTPMVEHLDPKKKNVPALAAAAGEGGGEKAADGEAAGKDKDSEKDKDKDKQKEKDKDKDKGKEKEKAKSGQESGKKKKTIFGKKTKSSEVLEPSVPSKKSVIAAIAARRAAAQKEMEERRLERQKQLQQMRQQQQEEEKQRQVKLASKRPHDVGMQDVTKFVEDEQKTDTSATAPSGEGEDGKKVDAAKNADKDVYKFVSVYKHHLKRNAQQPLAIRFRVYGCWRKKRSFLLGENTLALWQMEEAVQTGKLKQNFELMLEERRFAISKLKHLSDSEEELQQQKTAAAKARMATKDMVDALLPPPSEGPTLVNQGELFLGLAYKQVNGHLEVAVIKACNMSNPRSVKPPTVYVKVELWWGPFPERPSPSRVLFKSRTLAVPNCRNPAWHETFAFPVSKSHLNDVSVMAKVYCKHTVPRTISLGWCSVGRNNCSEEALDHWSDMREADGEQVCSWHVLLKLSKEKTEGQLDSD